MYNIHIHFTSIINCVMSIHHIHPLSIRHIFTKHFPRYMVQWSFNIFCYEIFGGHNHRFHWTFVAIYPWKLARLLHDNTASSEPENPAKAAATLQPQPSPILHLHYHLHHWLPEIPVRIIGLLHHCIALFHCPLHITTILFHRCPWPHHPLLLHLFCFWPFLIFWSMKPYSLGFKSFCLFSYLFSCLANENLLNQIKATSSMLYI